MEDDILKKLMFEFISDRINSRSKELVDILSISAVISTENYLVQCELNVTDTSYPIQNLFGSVTKYCEVDGYIFNNWVRNRNAITWI